MTDAAPAPASSRFELGKLLGRGAMGVVYEAVERDSGRRVALKTLHDLDAEGTYRLKREFRALSEISHPNLVEFLELHVSAEESYFTMRLVEGERADRHFQKLAALPQSEREAEIRRCFVELLSGLRALHARGKLHRDLKPGNVIVQSDGRVVLLDFGLAVNIHGSRRSHASRQGAFAGTLEYAAPEQLLGTELSPASDLYSVGVMLYEALTGELPFEVRALLSEQRPMPVPPALKHGSVSAELSALCCGLLAPAPEHRTTLAMALERLAPGAPPPDPERRAPFVGRDHERERLLACFRASRDDLQCVRVVGESGMGKSTLVEEFANTLEADPDVVVLRSRCHPNESVPFRALDGIIDELARLLVTMPAERADAILPRDLAPLVRLFPVLGRRGAASAVPATAAVHATELRERAFDALRELFARLGDRSRLVLLIDDAQWADLDSLFSLRALLRRPSAPKLLLIAAHRPEASEHDAVLRTLSEAVPTDTERVELSPLDPGSLSQLIDALVPRALEAPLRERLVVESEGNPFFAHELCRFVERRGTPDISLAAALEDRLSARSPEERRVLDAIAVAGAPLPLATLRLVVDGATVQASTETLLRERLLRTVSRHSGTEFDLYHDRIRQHLLDRLEDPRALHVRLARAFEQHAPDDPALLVDHWLLAGELERAERAALSAAERAERALAYHRAASLYHKLRDLSSTQVARVELLEKLGDALVNAGRGAEGAECFLEATASAAPLEPALRLRLRRRAGEELLRAGLYERGVEVMRAALTEAGFRYPESAGQALFSILKNRSLRVFSGKATPSTEPTSPYELERLELLWSAGAGLSLFDALRAFDFQVRHARLAQRLGEPVHLAKAVATEALVIAWEGGGKARDNSQKVRVEAELLAEACASPRARAHAFVMNAGVSWLFQSYEETLEICDRGLRFCREQGTGVAWEVANLHWMETTALWSLGRYRDFSSKVSESARRAQAAGDEYWMLLMRNGRHNSAWLARGDVEGAAAAAEQALEKVGTQGFFWSQAIWAKSQIDLYRGEPAAAAERLQQAFPTFRRSAVLRFEVTRVELADALTRSLHGAYVASGRNRHGAEARALERATRTLEKESGAFARPYQLLWQGVRSFEAGDRDRARRKLELSALGFTELRMSAHTLATRRLLGQLAGSPSVVAHAEQKLAEAGAEEPKRFVRLLVPTLID